MECWEPREEGKGGDRRDGHLRVWRRHLEREGDIQTRMGRKRDQREKRAGPDRTGPTRTEPVQCGLVRTGPVRFGPDRFGSERTVPRRT